MIATPRKAWNGTIRKTNSSRAMWGRRQRDGSRPTSGHQNSSPTARKCRWTSVVDQRLAQGQVEQRREVERVQGEGEQHPGDQRVADHPQRRAVQHPGHAAAGPAPGHPQGQGDRRAQGQQRGGEHGEQHVLGDVDREQHRVVGLDRRQQGHGEGADPGQEAGGPPGRPGHPVGDQAPPGLEVGDGRGQQPDGDQRVERPGEQQPARGRGRHPRAGRRAGQGGARARDGQAGQREDAGGHHPAPEPTEPHHELSLRRRVPAGAAPGARPGPRPPWPPRGRG